MNGLTFNQAHTLARIAGAFGVSRTKLGWSVLEVEEGGLLAPNRLNAETCQALADKGYIEVRSIDGFVTSYQISSLGVQALAEAMTQYDTLDVPRAR